MTGVLDNYIVKRQILQRCGPPCVLCLLAPLQPAATARELLGGSCGAVHATSMTRSVALANWPGPRPPPQPAPLAAPRSTPLQTHTTTTITTPPPRSAPIVASQLLLVDEVLRAGMNMRRQ